MIDIIVLSYKRLSTTQDFLKALYTNTPKAQFNLILLDNGSEKEAKNYLSDFEKAHDNCKFISLEENLGVIRGRNRASEESKSDLMIFLDNDQIVWSGWLVQHLSALESGNYDLIGIEAWQMNRAFYPIQKIESIKKPFHYVGCGGMLMKKEVWRDLKGFDNLFSPAYFEDPDFCYDKETKLLTDNGVKYIKDVTLNDNIITLNDNNEIECQKPTRLVKKFEEKLLHFKSQQIDICCTKDQNLLVGYNRKEWRGVDKGRYDEIDFITADDINRKLRHRQSRYFIRKGGGKWKGEQRDYISIGNSKYKASDFVKFMGWYLSEGSVYPEEIRVKRRGYDISVSQIKNEDKRNEIYRIVRNLGFSPRFDKMGIKFAGKNLYSYLQKLGKSHEKFVPSEIKNLSTDLLSDFLECYIKGDGSIKKSGYSIATNSEKMKDDLIEIIIKLGRSATSYEIPAKNNIFPDGKLYFCKKIWQIQSYNKNISYLNPAVEIDYNDFTYDIVVPNHRIFVIRNNKGCWSSNCWRALEKGYKIGWNVKARLTHMPHQTLGTNNGAFLESYNKFRVKWFGHTVQSLMQVDLPVFH